MRKEDCQVGQLIHFSGFYKQDSIYGRIIRIEGEFVYINWLLQDRSPGKPTYSLRFKNQATFDNITLVSQEQILQNKQERINQRIKKLWNNSNWVKNNPAQAY